MGLKPRAAPRDPAVFSAIAAYQKSRARAHELWQIYDGQPRDSKASADDLARLADKLGSPLPADFEAFLRAHDGWEGYEYDRILMSATEILDDAAAESVEINIDNMDADDADALENAFVIGCDNDTATILFYDRRAAGAPELVELYCDEQQRWPSLTAYFEHLTAELDKQVAEEQERQRTACSDWDPDVRAGKDQAYRDEINERLAQPRALSPVLTSAAAAAIRASFAHIGPVPEHPENLNESGLKTYLTLTAYMLYTPTADEVTTAVGLFREHFPWRGRTLACSPSREYNRKPVDPDAPDYSAFLKVRSGGHFGLRMVDDDGGEATQHIFNFRGAPEWHGEPIAAFLEILLPTDADHRALRSLVLELADALPLAHGFAGYAALPLSSSYVEHMRILHGWCRAHWGLQIALADELVPLALHGLHGVSWLTLVDNATADSVSLPPLATVHRRERVTVIEAADRPGLGDVREGYPEELAAVHQALSPLFAPGISELRHFDNQGATQAWWHRFEQPGAFALAPSDVLAEVEDAVAASNVDAAKAAWAKLDGREPAARECLKKRVSELAFGVLDDNNDVAMVLYDWLTQMDEPQLHDLNNSLVAAWKDPEQARVFVDRALPRAERNPSIFHNVIGLYTEHGDLDRAVDIARRAEPHYPIRLFLKLESDPDFAPLFERPDFVEIHDKMKARLVPTSSWPPLARNPELEHRVGSNPKDVAVYREYAAWLAGQGDPRGPLIEAHIDVWENPRSKPHRAVFRERVDEYIRNRLQSRFPQLGEQIDKDVFEWGVIHDLYISSWPEPLREHGLTLLADIECRLLRWLHLKNMSVELDDIAAHVPYLTQLNLTGADYGNLDAVARLEQLDELVLSRTEITDLSPLRGHPTLRKLYLKETDVVDLSPISRLPRLEFVSLEGASTTDIEPLLELPRLCEVWLYKTSVPKHQAERVFDRIKSRGVEPGPGVTTMVYGP